MGTSKLKHATQATMTTVSEGPTETFPYMAPVMFTEGHRETAVDIYALGCVYTELMGQRRVRPRMGNGNYAICADSDVFMHHAHYIQNGSGCSVKILLMRMRVPCMHTPSGSETTQQNSEAFESLYK